MNHGRQEEGKVNAPKRFLAAPKALDPLLKNSQCHNGSQLVTGRANVRLPLSFLLLRTPQVPCPPFPYAGCRCSPRSPLVMQICLLTITDSCEKRKAHKKPYLIV